MQYLIAFFIPKKNYQIFYVMIKNILIISNDRLFIKNDIISSDYNDTVNIVEGLAKKFFEFLLQISK